MVSWVNRSTNCVILCLVPSTPIEGLNIFWCLLQACESDRQLNQRFVAVDIFRMFGPETISFKVDRTLKPYVKYNSPVTVKERYPVHAKVVSHPSRRAKTLVRAFLQIKTLLEIILSLHKLSLLHSPTCRLCYTNKGFIDSPYTTSCVISIPIISTFPHQKFQPYLSYGYHGAGIGPS